jgi:hypothetical protein
MTWLAGMQSDQFKRRELVALIGGAAAYPLTGQPQRTLTMRRAAKGNGIYGADLKLPGMLNAAIKECPVHRGKITWRRRHHRVRYGRQCG